MREPKGAQALPQPFASKACTAKCSHGNGRETAVAGREARPAWPGEKRLAGRDKLGEGRGGGGGGEEKRERKAVSLSPGEKTAGLLHEKSALGAETQAPAQRERGMHMARALLYCAQLAYLFTENELICSCLFAQIE